MNTLLIVDVESTGLDPRKDALIEVGAILFDIKHRAVTHQFSALLPSVAPNGAEAVNGISDALLESSAVHRLVGWETYCLQSFYDKADAVVSHKVSFDRPWLEPLLRTDDKGQPRNWPLKPWICTLQDVRWARPGLKANPSLTRLALAHGVPVWAAHRALTDCTYLAQVLATREDLLQLLLDAQVPTLLYVALVTYEDRQLAKDAGFRWEDHGFLKAWTCYLREDEVSGLPFKVMAVTRPEELTVEFSGQFTRSPAFRDGE